MTEEERLKKEVSKAQQEMEAVRYLGAVARINARNRWLAAKRKLAAYRRKKQR